MRQLIFWAVVVALVIAGNCFVDGQSEKILTNAQELDSCANMIITNARTHFPPGHMDVYVDSSRDAFFITGPLFRAARAVENQGHNSGTQLVSAVAAICRAHVETAAIRYKKIGEETVLRSAEIQTAVDIHDATTAIILWSDVLSASIADTIKCGDIAKLESPDIPATHAPDPCAESAGVFSSIIEPVIFAAAAATIVFLLFTTRSQ
jgi:hypothetical protein